MIAFISCGSIQLLVGPQSFSSTLQMKVRSSTRATSVGSEAAWKEFGFFVRVEPGEGAARDQGVGQLGPLLVGAGAPVHAVRLGELGDLGDPGEDALVGRGRRSGRCGLGRVGGHAHRFLSRIRVLGPGAPGTTDGHRRRSVVCRGVDLWS